MFERNRKLTSLSPSVESLFEIYSSINTPLVAVEENPTEQTRGYIVIITNKRDEYDFYIFLHLLNSNRGIFYVAEKINKKDYSETKNNAFNFLESMGFLMERVFSLEEGEAKAEEHIKTLPMFLDKTGQSAEEVIKLEDEEVIEIKEEVIEEREKKEETGTIDEVEILLDEVEKQEKKGEKEIQKKLEKKNTVVGKIQVKSIAVQTEEGDYLKRFEPFFRFLISC
jgi:hypothetical protein